LSLGKKDIVKNISSETFLINNTSKALLESFLNLLKNSKYKKIKISNFGTFYLHETPKRMGRNPRTMEEFTIPKRTKLVFKASSSLKNNLN
tara:strand:- start:11726 stop:11998 length:273 start_codon:yes stop_codon:yes gene_type:complete